MGKVSDAFWAWLDRSTQYLDAKNPDAEYGGAWSLDWCRFRRHRFCYFPDAMDREATTVAGYPVWVPLERGICWRDKWEAQQACPVGEPGPNSEDPRARTDATVPWSIGGQRGGRFDPAESLNRAEQAARYKDALPLYAPQTGREFHPSAYRAAAGEEHPPDVVTPILQIGAAALAWRQLRGRRKR